jgi:alkylation response protein AidB-like acyl-CoA dehydrogenase
LEQNTVSQPNNYGFEEEAALLKDSARRFFAEKLPVHELHALVAADAVAERAPGSPWREDLWQEMVELGWTALAVPEDAGGLAMPWVAVTALLEEAGRAAFPSPLLDTLCCTAVLAQCGAGAAAALSDIASGKAATLAAMDAGGAWASGAVTLRDGRLEGEAFYVQDPEKCSHLLVLAGEGAALSLHWVAMDAPGVTVIPDAIVDLTRGQGRVRLDAVEGSCVNDSAEEAWRAALPVLFVLYSADMVGAAEWQLQTTVDYAQQRKQFDRQLGFFQAVKHDLVNVMCRIDESRSLLYSAACALDHEPARAQMLAHMVKSSASDTANFASGRSVQCHGGIGFTWESYLHLYFKRQKHSELLWGDAAWHRARLAELVIDRAA